MGKQAGTRVGLGDLGQLREQIRQRELELKAERERLKAEADQRAAEANLFRDAIGEVTLLRQAERVAPARPKPQPLAEQTARNDREVLQSTLSDEFDVENMLDIDESLSYRRPGVSDDVPKRMRRGDWVVQAQIDLHGLRRDEAREALAVFLRQALRRGQRCVRVIHGKGLGSPAKMPVLKNKVRSWLVQKDEVIAFVEPLPTDGGAGALLVLLRPTPSPAEI